MTLIIGLSGPAGSGKSTVAAAIEKAHPGIARHHIKAPLAAMLEGYYRTLGLSDPEIERRINGDLKRAPDPLLGGQTPTYAQQTLGTDWGRCLMHPDFWVAPWVREAVRRRGLGLGTMNEGVRYQNEVEAIRKLGGIVVELVGRRDDRVDFTHSSEAGVNADYQVSNAPGHKPEDVAARVIQLAMARIDVKAKAAPAA
ncbi:MAG: deoxynucleotide monophosphate kinase [Pseudomonadota bacterium]